MDSFLKYILVFIIVSTTFCSVVMTQNSADYELRYEVNRVQEPLSMSRVSLMTADSLSHLKRLYRSSWIREYLLVEISAIHSGELKIAEGNTGALNHAQKELMYAADTGTDITVTINYVPENDLAENDPKVMSFSFGVFADQEATFSGGETQLEKYLKVNLIDKFEAKTLKQYQMVAVKFLIDVDGYVVSPKVFWSSENTEMDQLLLDVACNMPNWTPAKYEDGTKVAQEFALTVGDHNSCVMPLLNIDENWLSSRN